MKKIILVSSVGGHLEQLLGLEMIMRGHEATIVTEANDSTNKLEVKDTPIYLLPYISRKNKIAFTLNYMRCFIISFRYFIRINPDIIVSTGAGCTLPLCLIGKIFGRKIIFIETFARVKTKTVTGRVCYYFADVFIVQWKELLKIYPKAIYLSHIY